MQLYRFSPIQDIKALLEAIEYIHFSCFALCKQSFGGYLPVAGNVGVFCHYNDEYENLIRIRKELTAPSDNPDQKYFLLYEPIVIPASGDVPETTYTHLYIRRPDPYRAQVGDIDLQLGEVEYQKLKQVLLDGMAMEGARVFERPDLDMVELHNPDVDTLAYVSPRAMTEKVRTKQSDFTKL